MVKIKNKDRTKQRNDENTRIKSNKSHCEQIFKIERKRPKNRGGFINVI